jgi:hypothetical protein
VWNFVSNSAFLHSLPSMNIAWLFFIPIINKFFSTSSFYLSRGLLLLLFPSISAVAVCFDIDQLCVPSTWPYNLNCRDFINFTASFTCNISFVSLYVRILSAFSLFHKFMFFPCHFPSVFPAVYCNLRQMKTTWRGIKSPDDFSHSIRPITLIATCVLLRLAPIIRKIAYLQWLVTPAEQSSVIIWKSPLPVFWKLPLVS